MKKEDQVYGQRLAEMAKKHSGKAFYAFNNSPEAAIILSASGDYEGAG